MLDRKWVQALGLVLGVAGAGMAGELSADDDGLGPALAGSAPSEEASRLRALKEARAEAILAREEGRGRPFDPAFRAEMKARLAEASMEDLDLVDRRGYGLLPEPKALGDSSADLVYTPVPPCRIVDTRSGGGALGAGFQRNFYVAGPDGFPTQGGNPTGCGLPRGPATAAVINFVAVNPGGAGNLRAWAYGAPVPTASIINYAAVGMNIANAVVVPLCDAASSSCTPGDITVQADVSGAHLVADVVGYFRNVVKNQYRSIVVSAVRSSLFADLPAASCANTGGTEVTLVAPVAGRVVVHGRATYTINHTLGATDHINTWIGTSPTDCTGDFGLVEVLTVPPEHPTSTIITRTGNSTRVFDVGPGTHTFYLNPRQAQGGGNDRLSHGSLVATFHPN
jgi:hypothetical protein